MKTKTRWLVVGIPSVITVIALWWNAPAVTNTKYWYLGFGMDALGAAIGFCMGIDISWRMRYARRVAARIYGRTGVWVSAWECLDVPYMSDQALEDRLELFKLNPEPINHPLHALMFKEN